MSIKLNPFLFSQQATPAQLREMYQQQYPPAPGPKSVPGCACDECRSAAGFVASNPFGDQMRRWLRAYSAEATAHVRFHLDVYANRDGRAMTFDRAIHFLLKSRLQRANETPELYARNVCREVLMWATDADYARREDLRAARQLSIPDLMALAEVTLPVERDDVVIFRGYMTNEQADAFLGRFDAQPAPPVASRPRKPAPSPGWATAQKFADDQQRRISDAATAAAATKVSRRQTLNQAAGRAIGFMKKSAHA